MPPLKRRIMSPGPVEIPPAVLAAAGMPQPHHRTREFRTALQEALAGAKRVLDTTHPVLPLAASGTGGMEACVANLTSPGDEVLVTVCGNFSQRWAEIGEAYGLTVHRLETTWGEPVDPRELAAKMRRHDHYRAVFTVFSETSTGIENDIEAIGKLVGATDSLLVVDGISGVGALPFHTDAWGVDALVVGSQKGLMVPPGLALVALSDKARKRLPDSRHPKFYFSFEKALKALEADALPDTPFTPPVSLLLQLREAVRAIEAEGLANVWARGKRLGDATRAAVLALGLKLLPSKGFSNVLTAVDCTDGPDPAQVVKRLRDEYGISIVGGQGKLKGRMFRLGHVGYVDDLDVLAMIGALEMVLTGMGRPVTLGAGVAAAQASLLKAGKASGG